MFIKNGKCVLIKKLPNYFPESLYHFTIQQYVSVSLIYIFLKTNIELMSQSCISYLCLCLINVVNRRMVPPKDIGDLIYGKCECYQISKKKKKVFDDVINNLEKDAC